MLLQSLQMSTDPFRVDSHVFFAFFYFSDVLLVPAFKNYFELLLVLTHPFLEVHQVLSDHFQVRVNHLLKPLGASAYLLDYKELLLGFPESLFGGS